MVELYYFVAPQYDMKAPMLGLYSGFIHALYGFHTFFLNVFGRSNSIFIRFCRRPHMSLNYVQHGPSYLYRMKRECVAATFSASSMHAAGRQLLSAKPEP